MKRLLACLGFALLGAAGMYVVRGQSDASGAGAENRAGIVTALRSLDVAASDSGRSAIGSANEAEGAGNVSNSMTRGVPRTAAWVRDLLERAEQEPIAILDEVLTLEDYWHRRLVLERIAAGWARRDAVEAIASIRALRRAAPPDRHAMLRVALDVWVDRSPRDVLNLLTSAEGQRIVFFECGCGDALARMVADAHAAELLAATANLSSGRVRTSLRRAALTEVVADDLNFALNRVAGMPPGFERQLWIEAIGPVYARADPVGASSWAQRLEATAPGVLDRLSQLVPP